MIRREPWAEDLFRRALDILCAAVLLLVLLPAMLVIAILVKLSSPGPVLFRQRRGGLDNREIVVWKFRTMTVHDEGSLGDKPQAKMAYLRYLGLKPNASDADQIRKRLEKIL